LGDRASYLVVTETKSLAPVLAAEPNAWPGRTTFLRLDVPHPASAVDRIDLSGEPGVVGRADQFVEAAPDLAALVRRLLGRYWLVDTFATAVHLAGGLGRGLNFITVAGEAVLADGALAVGPRQSVAGMLSRRSELRALRDEIETLRSAAIEAEGEGARLEQRIAACDAMGQRLGVAHADLVKTHSELRLRTGALSDRLDQADLRIGALAADRAALLHQLEELKIQQDQNTARERQLQDTARECRAALEAAMARRAELESQIAVWEQRQTDERVELARTEQRLEGLERQMEQLARDHAERDRALEETRARAAHCQSQRVNLQQTVNALAAEAAELHAEKGQVAIRLVAVERERQTAHAERNGAVVAADGVRAQVAAVQGSVQAARLQLHHCQQQRAALADRLRDDCQLDLASLAAAELCETPPAPLDREAVEGEIRELRDRLQAGGPVNLESIAELDTLEGRSGGLVAQYQDLEEARVRLEQIVAQLNGESRELFTEAVAEVRDHFKDIFSRLFAGGEADIIVEEDESGDVLECGVSIIARPPGKQPRNISLLSGGERTLTCVALLLAVFRSRPSPFCVLDEVDAALDEANIDRFVNLLKEFMTNTQFIVVTHSKRTMTCADTLHGVTMQDSGVSKPVCRRVEDVDDDRRIRASAFRNDATHEAPRAQAA
jgi:chromosome segregation protein